MKLTKEVPLYFLGGIYKKIEGKETFTVPVDSVAVVPAQTGGGFFNNMFIFKEKFDAVTNKSIFNSKFKGKNLSDSVKNIKKEFNNLTERKVIAPIKAVTM